MAVVLPLLIAAYSYYRCVSTGRKCDGYMPQHPTRNHPVQQSIKPLDLPTNAEKSLSTYYVTVQEHHALDYFFNRAAPMLSAYMDPPFWNRLVLQLGHSEPAIRHAIIGLSTAYEQLESHPKPLYTEASTRFSLQQYNKALNHLITYLSSNDGTPEILLITCVLFICLEYIQGDIDRARAHLLNGVNILQSWRKKGIHKRSPISKEMIDHHVCVDEYLIRTFSWLSITSSAF